MAKSAALERVCAPSITLAIRRLETLGMVKRSPDPADLRLVLVGITPKGLALHRKSLANRQASAVTLLSQLSQADLDSLTKALAPLERLASHADTRRCDDGSQTRRWAARDLRRRGLGPTGVNPYLWRVN